MLFHEGKLWLKRSRRVQNTEDLDQLFALWVQKTAICLLGCLQRGLVAVVGRLSHQNGLLPSEIVHRRALE